MIAILKPIWFSPWRFLLQRGDRTDFCVIRVGLYPPVWLITEATLRLINQNEVHNALNTPFTIEILQQNAY